jgi:hypothetical protein
LGKRRRHHAVLIRRGYLAQLCEAAILLPTIRRGIFVHVKSLQRGQLEAPSVSWLRVLSPNPQHHLFVSQAPRWGSQASSSASSPTR